MPESDGKSIPLPSCTQTTEEWHGIDYAVLARVRAFLPDFQASTNEILAQAATDPNAVNLERVRKGEGAVVMDLGLGVYDAPGLKGKEAGSGLGPVVDSSGSVPGQEEEESSGEDEDDTSENESSSSDEGTEDEPVETIAPTHPDHSK